MVLFVYVLKILYHIEREKSEGKTPLKTELGYSRDAHPELLQVMLQMITDSNGIPVYMKPQDGNTSDNTGFQTSFSIVRGLKDAIDFKYLVADAALFTQEISWTDITSQILSLNCVYYTESGAVLQSEIKSVRICRKVS